MTLGSLFDGSGTCPLAARLCGMTPIWASEIEPYPIRVTKKNFPGMRHLGDVTKVNGAEIEPVDVITFGSPCQDLSVAGAQKGLTEGKRSSLFFEAIRIITEMREATNGKYPRYAVWENVPGAFSSNSGRDFLEVLRAFVRAAGGNGADVPEPARRGRSDKLIWRHAGCIVGDGFSIAWRVLDAQYWGVPQRRKRIFLVCDFAGGRAGEILFKREGLPGDFEAGRKAGQENPGDAVGSAGRDYRAFDITGATSNSMKSPTVDSCFRERSVARTLDTWVDTPECNQGGNVVVVYDARGNGDGKIVPTLTGDHESRVTDYTALCVGNGQLNQMDMSDKAGALNCMHDQQAVMVLLKKLWRYIVRRLTPLECCRLQGFPDWWEDGVEGSDSARYKMWGNGMALPCVLYVMEGIADGGA